MPDCLPKTSHDLGTLTPPGGNQASVTTWAIPTVCSDPFRIPHRKLSGNLPPFIWSDLRGISEKRLIRSSPPGRFCKNTLGTSLVFM